MGNIWAIILTLSTLFYGVFASYYFSIVAPLDNLKEIRDHKIKSMISFLMIEKKSQSIDLLFLIDHLNHDNKVWLLETDTDDNISKFSLWGLGITTVTLVAYFLLRSSIISPTLIDAFNLIDIILIVVYVMILTWTSFTIYWEYVYYMPFFRHEKKMKKESTDVFHVVKS